jgi:hypothetical protein
VNSQLGKSLPAGLALFVGLVAHLRKYVYMADEGYVVLAAWILHCHSFKCATKTPYLLFTSPAPECGKTLTLELLERLVPNALMASAITNAALSRGIERFKPVMLLDELDMILKGDPETKAALLSTINSGYKCSGYRIVSEKSKGEGWDVRKLSTFSPKALAGIDGLLPDATRSRCIPIRMERAPRGHRLADPDDLIVEQESNYLFAMAAEWAKQNARNLRDARPDCPKELGHRQREVCRPLVACANTIGGDVPQLVRTALVNIFGATAAAPATDPKIVLLVDLRDMADDEINPLFNDDGNVRSADLPVRLAQIEASIWTSWGRANKPINEHQVAKLLSGFGVYPRRLYFGSERRRGYEQRHLEKAWNTYAPPSSPDYDRPTVPPTGSESTYAKSRPSQQDGSRTAQVPLASTDGTVGRAKQGDDQEYCEHRVVREWCVDCRLGADTRRGGEIGCL